MTETDKEAVSSGGMGPLGWIALALVAGFVCAWLGSVLSEKPTVPPPADSMHGLSTPAEMNEFIDGLLVKGDSAIEHDRSLLARLGLIIGGTCLTSLACMILYILRKRRVGQRVPPSWRTALVIVILALPPVAITCWMSIREGSLFQASGIVQRLQNENTSPRTVSRGTRVTVDIPVSMQSFFGYYEGDSITLNSASAYLPDGGRIPIQLENVSIGTGGRKPGKTDLIQLMENVKPEASMTVPDVQQLEGGIIEFAASGVIRVIADGEREALSPERFDTHTTFRVARGREVEFKAKYDQLSRQLSQYYWLSFPSAGIIIMGILLFTPGECRSCKRSINRLKLHDGHLCPDCDKSKKGDVKASADNTAKESVK